MTIGQRLLYRSFAKHLSRSLLTVTACVLFSCGLLVYHSLRRQGSENNGDLQSITNTAMSRDSRNISKDSQTWNSRPTLDNNFEVSYPDDLVFRSPYIVSETEELPIKNTATLSLDNRSSGLHRKKTFAVIWPCKGSAPGCFTRTSFPIETCPMNSCRQTWVLEKADVVVFHVYRMKHQENVPKFSRPGHQIWVMLSVEAPVRGIEFAMLDYPALKGQFNWTLTYRLDSDIPWLYGQLQKTDKTPAKNYEDIYRNKTTTAAWFVSHCVTPSNRDVYVQRMRKLVDIHVYGSCGNYSCADNSLNKRALDKDQCLPLLSKNYFFYLAFENSLCQDYVTEKFFKIFADIDVVPVVRGGADYKRYFPPNTFIDASDFKSPEHLAKFLIYLAKDKNRYISMLRDKSWYRLHPVEKWYCALCEKMHQDNAEKSYSDLRNWFSQGQCLEPNDM